jgi:uncharacterized membrane protein (DUF4010 family)
MLLRNAAIAAFTDPSLRLFKVFLVAALPMALVGGFFAYRQHARSPVRLKDGIRVKSPFALGPALKFAGLFAVLNVFAVLAQAYAGDVGVYLTAIGGFVSAGAVTASVATLLFTGKVSLAVAAQTSLLAVVIGTVNKIVILRAVEENVYARSRKAFAIMAAVGVACFLALLAASWLGKLPG